MYRIIANNPYGLSYTIYDPENAGALPVLSPRLTEELNEAGSLEYSLVYGHPAYGQLMPKKTYITVELDGEELFYGRVINAEPNPLTGQIQYSCAGALSLLQDSEVLADPKKSDGSSDSQSMTAQAFFEKCIQRHNTDVDGDERRTFQVGIISHSKKSETRTFQVSSNTDTLNALKQYILDPFGGFLRVRRGENGVHLIDWVEQYGDTDEGTLELGENIMSLANRFSSDNVFTSIRPIGANNLTLPNGEVMDVFGQEDMIEYGRIVKTVQFQSADTEAKLRTACQDMIDRMHKTLYISSEIGLLDMHFVDGQDHGVNLGDVYTGIHGLEGTGMTVAARNRDFNSPQNDSVSLKNAKEFDGGRTWDSGGSSSISKRSARSAAAGGMAYKYIHEFQDRLELNAKEIGIHAEQLGLHADELEITGNQIASLSRADDEMRDEIGAIKGTAVLQNSDFIASVAGRFVYDEVNHTLEVMNGTEFRLHDQDGATLIVGDRLTQLGEKTAQFEGSALWTNRDGIVGVAGEFDVVEKDGKRTLVVKSGGGMQVRRDNVEYGIYDEGNLDAGLIVDKLNDGTTVTKLRGDRIDLTPNSQHQELSARLTSTEEGIRSDVSAANSQIYSAIEQTATQIHRYVADEIEDVQSSITETASSIRSDVSAANSRIYSAIEQTATQIHQYVADEIGDVRTSITETASSIRSDVSAANSTIYSYIKQTASNIQTILENTEEGLYSYTNQTASGIHRVMMNTTNRVWVQDKDPTTEAGGSNVAKAGDIWVESTHQGSWDGAEGFDWEHDEGYDWTQIQGAKIWSWANDKWELVSDQQQTISYSEMIDSIDYYMNLKIKGLINEEGLIDVYMSKLEQTAEQIRSEVRTADSRVYSYIDQTATSINLGVGGRPTTIAQSAAKDGKPTKINGRNPVNNDIWIDTEFMDSWDDALDFSWEDENAIDWNKLRSDKIYVYKDGEWHLAEDGTVLAEDTDLQIERDHISLLARNIDTLDGYARENIADLTVKATQISARVEDKTNELGSRITQTATQIRSEVHSASSQLYSYISQTSTQIKSYVSNEIDDVHSSITQTASSIRSEVHSTHSQLYSSIMQTASSIRLEVANSISGVNSSITQTASKIRSEVNAANSKVYSAIQQTASSIRLEVANSISGVNSSITQTASSIRSEVNAANSKIYSAIQQTASSIRLEVADAISDVNSSITQTAGSIRSDVNAANSKIYSSIQQTASSIRLEVADAISGVNSSIQTQANRISLVVSGTGANAAIKPASIVSAINNGASSIIISASHIDLDGYVKATDLTADRISGLIAKIARVDVKALSASGMMYGTNIVASGYINANSFNIVKDETSTNINKLFVASLSLTQSGNTYTLKSKNGAGTETTIGTFSRAVTSWSVGGGSGKINVTANPQNQTKSVSVSIGGSKKITSNGSYTYKAYYENADGEDVETGASIGVTVNVPGPTLSDCAVYDEDSKKVTAITIDDETQLWAGYKKNGDWVWGSSVKVTPNKRISSWSVGGGSGKINVTANPQNQTKSVSVSIGGSKKITSNGSYTYKAYYENADGEDVETGASIGVTVNVPGPTLSDCAVYDEDSDGNPVKTTSITISSAKRLWAGYYKDGSFIWGGGITITPPSHPDKGSGWVCSIEELASGAKTVRLVKTFTPGASIPFTHNSNYHLYT